MTLTSPLEGLIKGTSSPISVLAYFRNGLPLLFRSTRGIAYSLDRTVRLESSLNLQTRIRLWGRIRVIDLDFNGL